MIVKGQEGHIIVSTAFKVHYNQKLGDPFGHLWGERTMASGGDRRLWLLWGFCWIYPHSRVPLEELWAQEFLFWFHEVPVRLKHFRYWLQDTLHYFVCQFVIDGALYSASAVEIYRVVWVNKLHRSIVRRGFRTELRPIKKLIANYLITLLINYKLLNYSSLIIVIWPYFINRS